MLCNIWHGFSVRSWWPHVLWQAVTSWLVNSSAIGALTYNRCLTGRRSRDENYVVRFKQSAENCSQARDMQTIRGVSDKLARGCKHRHHLTPGRRYGKKKSSLRLSLKQQQRVGPLQNKMRDIFIRKCFVRHYLWLCFRLFLYVGIQQSYFKKQREVLQQFHLQSVT